MTDDPIDALRRVLEASAIRLEALPESADMASFDLREIRLHADGQSITLPVFDEFRDADLPSRVVWLHLLLDTCECFEESSDELGWRADLGLPQHAIVEATYRKLAREVPRVRAVIGADVRAINAHAIEFGTMLAVRLRETRD